MFSKIYEKFTAYYRAPNSTDPSNKPNNKLSGVVFLIVAVLIFILIIFFGVISVITWNRRLESINKLLEFTKLEISRLELAKGISPK